jgi:hypothetical protein
VVPSCTTQSYFHPYGHFEPLPKELTILVTQVIIKGTKQLGPLSEGEERSLGSTPQAMNGMK